MTPALASRPLGWGAELRARGPREVGESFGLAFRGAPPSLSPCPACGQETRHRKSGDRRPAVNLTTNGAGWYCLQCGERGDAIKLAGWLVLGREPTAADLRAVRVACAARGLCAGVPGEPTPKVPRRALVAVPSSPARLEHLPAAEVEAFWAACRPLKEDPAALAYLLGRYGGFGYSARDFARIHDVVRATPLDGFPEWWPEKWARTYRVIVPAYTGRGVLAGIQARDVTDRTKLTGFAANAAPGPKTRWPLGLKRYSYSGLVFADKNGRALLAGNPPGGLGRVLVVEGLTDTVRATLYVRRREPLTAVLGLESGAAGAFREIRRWPRLLSGAPVPCKVLPDPDSQGDKYLDAVREALPASVPVTKHGR